MELPVWLNISLQIIVALVIILILYIATLYVLNIDSIVQNTGLDIKPKEVTTIVDGYAGPSFLYGLEFNTLNPFVDNFKRIARSANQYGGATFTYQFWIKVEEANDALFKNLVLFIKGDKAKYNLAYYNKAGTGNDGKFKLASKMEPDSYIACPSISFGDSYRQIKVRFNTNNEPYNEIFINMNTDTEPSARKNLLSLLPLNWTLLTFVFEDNYSIVENAENGIKFSMYINDIPYWIESASSTPVFRNDFIKQNDGNITLLPNLQQSSEFMKLGNIRYYNYAVEASDVKATYLKGPPAYAAVLNDEKNNIKPSYISALNKIDVYNY
jgi:hypothetical protein